VEVEERHGRWRCVEESVGVKIRLVEELGR